MIFLKLLTICLVTVIIVDLSGFVESMKSLISKILTKKNIDTTNFRLRPFDCSFCMTFWVCLIYTFVTNQFTLVNLLIILLLAFFTGPIKDLLLLLKDLITKLTNTINDKLIKD